MTKAAEIYWGLLVFGLSVYCLALYNTLPSIFCVEMQIQ